LDNSSDSLEAGWNKNDQDKSSADLEKAKKFINYKKVSLSGSSANPSVPGKTPNIPFKSIAKPGLNNNQSTPPGKQTPGEPAKIPTISNKQNQTDFNQIKQDPTSRKPPVEPAKPPVTKRPPIADFSKIKQDIASRKPPVEPAKPPAAGRPPIADFSKIKQDITSRKPPVEPAKPPAAGRPPIADFSKIKQDITSRKPPVEPVKPPAAGRPPIADFSKVKQDITSRKPPVEPVKPPAAGRPPISDSSKIRQDITSRKTPIEPVKPPVMNRPTAASQDWEDQDIIDWSLPEDQDLSIPEIPIIEGFDKIQQKLTNVKHTAEPIDFSIEDNIPAPDSSRLIQERITRNLPAEHEKSIPEMPTIEGFGKIRQKLANIKHTPEPPVTPTAGKPHAFSTSRETQDFTEKKFPVIPIGVPLETSPLKEDINKKYEDVVSGKTDKELDKVMIVGNPPTGSLAKKYKNIFEMKPVSVPEKDTETDIPSKQDLEDAFQELLDERPARNLEPAGELSEINLASTFNLKSFIGPAVFLAIISLLLFFYLKGISSEAQESNMKLNIVRRPDGSIITEKLQQQKQPILPGKSVQSPSPPPPLELLLQLLFILQKPNF
jgi:hypothetical protein